MGLGREILKIRFVKPILALGLGIAALGVYLGDQETKQTPVARPPAEAPPIPGQSQSLNTQVEAKVLGGFQNPTTFTREGFTWRDTTFMTQYQAETASVKYIGGDKKQAMALAVCAAALDLKMITPGKGSTLTQNYESGKYSDVAAKCDSKNRGNDRAFIVGPA